MSLINCPECSREVSQKAPSCPNCGAPIAASSIQTYTAPASPPEKKNVSCLTAGCTILLVLFFIGLIAGECGKSGSSTSSSSYAPAPPPPPSRDESALQNVKLVDFSWSTGGFNSVMLATFVIKNDNDFPVKDITITCTHFAQSGTEIDSNTHTIYDVVKAKKKRTFREVNMGFIHSQAASSRCGIKSFSAG